MRAFTQILKSGALYFGLVFCAGFVFGTVRLLWAVPRFGERVAELIEAPIRLGVTILAARWVVRRLALARATAARLGMGLVGLGLLLVAELAVVFLVRGLTLTEYLASRDVASGTVYLALLVVFVVMPLLIGCRSSWPT